MRMADALVNPAVAGAMYDFSAAAPSPWALPISPTDWNGRCCKLPVLMN